MEDLCSSVSQVGWTTSVGWTLNTSVPGLPHTRNDPMDKVATQLRTQTQLFLARTQW